MSRWIALLLTAIVCAGALAEDETPLPLPDSSEPLEIEPPLLIPTRAPDGTIPDLVGTPAAASNADLAKLESDLARAEKRAASGERLFKAGIIAKIDAEQRALKVVQLTAAVAAARLQIAKAQAEEKTKPEADDTAVVDAEEAAKRAAEAQHRAELEQALRNLQRQQKLLALGSGRRADVNRAEQKVAELKRAE